METKNKNSFLLMINKEFLRIELEGQRRIIDEVEAYCNSKLNDYDVILSEIKDDEEREHAFEYYENDIYFYRETAINTLRTSQVLGIYSLFDYIIEQISDLSTDNPIKIGDLRGSLTDRLKKYLKVNLGEEANSLFSGNDRWSRITKYVLIRNCIAHDGGYTKPDSAKRKAVEELELVSLHNSKISLQEGFCHRMLDDISDFIFELYEIVGKVNK